MSNFKAVDMRLPRLLRMQSGFEAHSNEVNILVRRSIDQAQMQNKFRLIVSEVNYTVHDICTCIFSCSTTTRTSQQSQCLRLSEHTEVTGITYSYSNFEVTVSL